MELFQVLTKFSWKISKNLQKVWAFFLIFLKNCLKTVEKLKNIQNYVS